MNKKIAAMFAAVDAGLAAEGYTLNHPLRVGLKEITDKVKENRDHLACAFSHLAEYADQASWAAARVDEGTQSAECLNSMILRMGMMLDRLSVACGGTPVRGDAIEWFDSISVQAFCALQEGGSA